MTPALLYFNKKNQDLFPPYVATTTIQMFYFFSLAWVHSWSVFASAVFIWINPKILNLHDEMQIQI